MSQDDMDAKLEETLRNQDVSSDDMDRTDKDMLEEDMSKK